MQQKNITGYEKEYESKAHPSIKGLQIIEGKNNFPISWLKQQGYCEYQLYLELFEDMENENAPEISHGNEIKNQLENIFKQDSETATFEEVIEASKKEPIMVRECFLISPEHGINGTVEEIWMTPEEITIIEDSPGRTPYLSTMNPVRAFCLAFKNMTNDERPIKAALRERGTGINLFWIEVFTPEIEKEIEFTIDRVHGLLDETKPFKTNKNPKKCRACGFKHNCEHAIQ